MSYAEYWCIGIYDGLKNKKQEMFERPGQKTRYAKVKDELWIIEQIKHETIK